MSARLTPPVAALSALALMLGLGGCLAATAVSMTASALVTGTKIAGKTVYYAGKGVYKVGELTVRAADGALDGDAEKLRLTIISTDDAGREVRTTRDIRSEALDSELAALERTPGVTEVVVEELG